VVLESIRTGKPYLGLCLGLQILFDGSDESPDCAGWG
jgi:glutamine amidotransferase